MMLGAPALAQTAADYTVQRTGDPAFNCGWTWYDTTADAGCTGSTTSLTDDGSYDSSTGTYLNMCGMSFNFLGDSYTDLNVHSNGCVSFWTDDGSDTLGFRQRNMGNDDQSSNSFDMICPWWSDWYPPSAPGQVSWGRVTRPGGTGFIVSWESMDHWAIRNSTSSYRVDFQVVLWDDQSIQFNYFNTDFNNITDTWEPNYVIDYGESGAAGFQSTHGGTTAYDALAVSDIGSSDMPPGTTIYMRLTSSPAVDFDGDGAPEVCDCDDTDPTIWYGNPEICGDGIDNDCDGIIDNVDQDRDGYTDVGCGGDDCDDLAFTVNPGATERCDGVDEDCDGTVDNGFTYVNQFVDADSDGYGVGAGVLQCPGAGATQGGDCDDADPTVNPGVTEVCDGADNNCDTQVDEGFTYEASYVDADGDGFGDENASSTMECPGVGSSNNLDCDDADPAVSPGATEVCESGVDENCDGVDPQCTSYCSWVDDANFEDPGAFGAPDILSTNQNLATALPFTFTYAGTAYDFICLSSEGWVRLETSANCTITNSNNVPQPMSFQPNDMVMYVWQNDWEPDDPGQGVFTKTVGNRYYVRWVTNRALGTDDAIFTLVLEQGSNQIYMQYTDVDVGLAWSNNGLRGTTGIDFGTSPGEWIEIGFNTSYLNPGDRWGFAPDQDSDGDGFGTCSGDCDDADPATFPGAAEICDGIDNNCDGLVPGNEQDIDSDGISECEGDCNDSNSSIYPGAVETCNSIDDDCNGTIDEGIGSFWYRDSDSDAHGDPTQPLQRCFPPAGYVANDSDCDDNNAQVNPSVSEQCDGFDNNCNGLVDEGLATDTDGDGHYTPTSCTAPNDDCDDTDPDVYTGAPELCDGKDNDCDGVVDDGLSTDADADGHFSIGSCATPADDCDDTNSTVFPGALEACDGIDNNCDGTADEGLSADADGDGHYATGSCATPADDCDDTNPAIYGGAVEICDGIDNDCDGLTDDGLSTDADADGHYTPGSCATPNDDCDDANGNVFPGRAEACDGIDNNCDGSIDEGLSTDVDGDGHYTPGSCLGPRDDCDDADPNTFGGAPELCDAADNDCDALVDEGLSQDVDGDGHYSLTSCNTPNDDCDDNSAAVYPGRVEVCDGLDNNCDGVVDEGLSSDADGDGHYAVGSCAAPADDCDDTDPNSYGGAAEVCDGTDNDCDTLIDEGLSTDSDGDGHYTPGSCATPNDDCDDSRASVYPGRVEACDSIDNNCDGSVDEGLSTDADGDGHYTPGSCAGPADDCNDADNTVFGGAPEVCDGQDNDCDSLTDEGLSTDNDGDGHYSLGSCLAPADDCNDGNANMYPGRPEICDGLDNDCDGVTPPGEDDADGDGVRGCQGDCDDSDPLIFPGSFERCNGLDDNCDGVVPANERDPDADGVPLCAGDCDDNEPAAFPGNPEVCDGIDNNCDGAVDEGLGSDADGDGHFDAGGCGTPNDDCNDADPTVYGGAPELCDGIDNDCDGAVPAAESDLDGDGVTGCGGDCDDADPAVNPGAAEACNAVDDNCDGAVDEGFDIDGDGVTQCGADGVGGNIDDDCDDLNPGIYPGAPELCDGVDNNCNGTIADEGADADGDGVNTCTDCDDNDPLRYPGAPEVCNSRDDDCDGTVPANERDFDGDGVSTCGGDCDDSNALRFPGNPEVCDGVDNDCAFGVPFTETDDDGDTVPECLGDCDDANPQAFPGNSEACDSVDNDCDGQVDEGLSTDTDNDGHYTPTSCATPNDDCDDANPDNYPGNAEICDGGDNDCDGSIDEGLSTDADGDGRYAPGSCLAPADDCDDTDPAAFPGNPEVCDGIDNNCDLVVDEGLSTDADGDGHYTVGSCFAPADDCDDGSPLVFPGNAEVCDSIDNNCDGAVDEGLSIDNDGDGRYAPGSCLGPADDCDDADPNNFPGNPETCDSRDNNCDAVADEGLSVDADGDGHFTVGSCSLPADDCDDGSPLVFPGNPEVCDGIDNDCDGVVDQGLDIDADGDGVFAPGSCAAPNNDCDDTDPNNFPGNAEACDSADNDCDGRVDNGLSTDTDGDGHYAPGSCAVPADDCDDGNPARYPGRAETCDGLDNDCDTLVDNGLSVDADLDGHYTPGSCFGPADDCNDADPGVYPGNAEQCDGADNDCDGQVDEGLSTDADLDGHYTPGSCATPADDCDDNNPAGFPGNPEVCDGLDNNCNGSVDEGLSTDNDGDGRYAFGSCLSPANDCDDTDATVYTGAPELCDRIDNNCDGALPVNERDVDGDGIATCEGDCDDARADTYPGAVEVPYNGRDEDCDGADLTDRDGDGFDGGPFGTDCHDQDPTINPSGSEGAATAPCDGVDDDCNGAVDDGLDCTDDDGDGLSEDAGDCDDSSAAVGPNRPEVANNGLDDNCDGIIDGDLDGDGWADFGGDCNDGDASVNPGAPEGNLCDGVDNDCNGLVDDGTPCWDGDGDGWAADAGDCDDANPAVGPGAAELPDGIDNDCDGMVDEGTAAGDDDGDNFCEGYDIDGDGLLDCGDSSLPGDCADDDPAVSPGATELDGDGYDNDCDGDIDLPEADSDGDGYVDSLDCAPNDATVRPGAPELPDGLDQDCDGRIDEGTLSGDDDGDGFCEGFDIDGDGLDDCGDGAAPGDCDDSDTEVGPAAGEQPDGVDNDCDGVVDEDTIYFDDDGDGYSEFGGDCDDGDDSIFPGAEEVRSDGIDQDCDGEDAVGGDIDNDGWLEEDGDCDDSNPAVNPGAVEICDNGVDDDCDGEVDPGELCDVPEPEVGGGCRSDLAVSESDSTKVWPAALFLMLLCYRRNRRFRLS